MSLSLKQRQTDFDFSNGYRSQVPNNSDPTSEEGLLDGICNHLIFTTHAKINNSLGGSLVTGEYYDATTDSEPPAIESGIFKRNPKGWNIEAACQWLHAHSGPNSQHACAKYVRMAIEAGGLSTAGRPTWAWKYISYLPTIGFKLIKQIGRAEMSQFTPEPGDIAVYLKGNDKNVPGHICMWTGKEWASDFKQRNMMVYSSTPSAYIYRFNG